MTNLDLLTRWQKTLEFIQGCNGVAVLDPIDLKELREGVDAAIAIHQAQREKNHKLLTEYDQGHNGKTPEEMYAEQVESDLLPSWCNAPTAPGLWVSSAHGACKAWRLPQELLNRDYWDKTELRWFGPIPEDTK